MKRDKIQLNMYQLCFAAIFIIFSSVPLSKGFHSGRMRVKSSVGSGSISSLRMSLVTHFEEVIVQTNDGVSVHDITEEIAAIVGKTGCEEGLVTVLSKHSTVGISINEMEPRMVDDIRQFFVTTVDPNHPWLHNDLDYRVGPPGYEGGDEAWREMRRTQPVNAHSHLIAMLLGTSESVPISKGKMQKGTFQNILVIEADGFQKKKRTVCVQVMGKSRD